MQTPLVQPVCSYGCENSREGAELSRKLFTGCWGGMAALSALLGTWRQSSSPPRSPSVPSAPPHAAGPCCGSAPWLPPPPRVGGSIPEDEVEHVCACTVTSAIPRSDPSPGEGISTYLWCLQTTAGSSAAGCPSVLGGPSSLPPSAWSCCSQSSIPQF